MELVLLEVRTERDGPDNLLKYLLHTRPQMFCVVIPMHNCKLNNQEQNSIKVMYCVLVLSRLIPLEAVLCVEKTVIRTMS